MTENVYLVTYKCSECQRPENQGKCKVGVSSPCILIFSEPMFGTLCCSGTVSRCPIEDGKGREYLKPKWVRQHD